MTEEMRLDYEPPKPKGKACRALVVRNGKIDEVSLAPSSEAGRIHELIGNYFTSCFTVDDIVGYCDDEFLLKSPEEIAANWNVVLQPGVLRRDFCPIGGPIVIVGVTPDGDTRSLTTEEMARFFLMSRPVCLLPNGPFLPVLGYRRQED